METNKEVQKIRRDLSHLFERFRLPIHPNYTRATKPPRTAKMVNNSSEEFDDFFNLDQIPVDDRPGVPHYPIPDSLREALDSEFSQKTWSQNLGKCGEILKKLQSCDKIIIEEACYQSVISLGVFIEMYQAEQELKKYNCNGRIQDAGYYVVQSVQDDGTVVREVFLKYKIKFLKKFADKPPANRGDQIDVAIMTGSRPNLHNSRTLTIEEMRVDHVIASIAEGHSFEPAHFRGTPTVSVKFCLNTHPFDCCHFALREIKRNKTLRRRLFPVDSTNETPFLSDKTTPKIISEWHNKNISSNPEQKEAVEKILNKSSYPEPFILFGPPGTGKTTTIVEAIIQILNQDELSHKILVCAPSNSAADNVAEKLVSNGFEEETIRLYASSAHGLFKKLSESSGAQDKATQKNDKLRKLIASKRVVICTLCFCSRLVLLEIKCFDYIFIDEAGQATEPDAIIPFNLNQSAHIILAGDPKQLGPVVKNKLAQPILAESLMERLLARKVYQKDELGNYNPKYVVQLLNNYRSHPEIVKITNELFYENKLRSCRKKKNEFLETASQKEPSKLDEELYPVIFHQREGKERSERTSKSSFNPQEIGLVLQYVKDFLNPKSKNKKLIGPEHIGVITPFKLQCEKLKEKFERANIVGVEVGTVENFQGREKEIIILSTVRSKIFNHDGKWHIGSLQEPKRLNVATSRAKSLMIVIGDPEALKIDKNWLKIINFCVDKESCTDLKIEREKLQQPPNCKDPFYQGPTMKSRDLFPVRKNSVLEMMGKMSLSHRSF